MAKKIFIFAENDFLNQYTINLEWLQKKCEGGPKTLNNVKISLLCFLEEQGILKLPDKNDAIMTGILKQIERCPKEFARLMEIYCNVRLELRKRQISNNEVKPLKLITISCDLNIFIKLAKWIIQEHAEVSSWDLIQEEHINEFLLTLNPTNRELVRKDLYVLFKMAKQKKIITYIPMINYPSRELPLVMEPLNINDQKRVAILIQKSIHLNPLGGFLSSLCFYHGISTKQIQSIKLSDIDLLAKKINIKDRPPVYLLIEDLISLENYSKMRTQMRNNKKRDYLIIGDRGAKIYENKPLGARAILRKVKELTGYTTKQLRITCFQSLSAIFGPLMLIEAFGLSKTQASRYGRFEEYLLEEEIKAQRD
ncbi:hypothetical protein [Clostridium sp.]|uniref:hypothetical protein n=1 Tax=Clostridium sp. TaxID=1506 RepID=UPI001A629723|nr:hypothetical protein [Clostridium sp.]MBK5243153.1 hypothetical protein [Clostridium sp.]